MRRLIALASALALSAVGSAFGQTVSSTTGTIDGKVTDISNAVLPGVTVSIASESMMGTRDAVTSGTGTFRFVSITPGTYNVTFELPGFATVKRTVDVGAGFTATLNIQMNVAGLEEAVTVTGTSPVVDTTATKVTTSFSSEKLATTPNGSNDPWAMLAETPAVKMDRIDVGGSTAGTQTQFTTYGTTGQRPYYEGINGTEGTTNNGNYVDMNAFDEVAVNTVGNNAEMGPPGVMMVFVVKSGGNTYHGAAGSNYENQDWQSFNIDAAQVAAGVKGGGGLEPKDTNRMHAYRDSFAQLGGYVVKDKLWWFGSFRDNDSKVLYTNFPVKPFRTQLRVYQLKGTYQLTQNNKFIGYYQYNTKAQFNRLDRYTKNATTAFHSSADSSFWQHYAPRIWKGEFNSVLSDAMYLEVRAGQWGYDWNDTNYTTAPSYEDSQTNEVFGAARIQYINPRRNQVLGSLSYFRPGSGTSSHNFKFGWEIFRETTTNGMSEGSYDNIVHILRNGAPLEVYLLGTPWNNSAGLWNEGLYATDTWRLNNKVTMNLGVRYDRYQNFRSDQLHAADPFFAEAVQFPAVNDVRTWNVAAPRFGVSYNVTGDGRTVVKANAGLYWNNPGTSNDLNPNGQWRFRYGWSDLNGDRVWEPGEQQRLISSDGGVATVSRDPNEKDPYTIDTSVWLERELISDLAVRAGFVHREERQQSDEFNANQPFDAFNIPVTITDPGPDGVSGTADDAGTLQAWNLDPAFVGLPSLNLIRNFDGVGKFDTIEVALNKRMSRDWSMSASYSFTKSRALRQPTNPNALINANADGQDETTDYSFKLGGTFLAPAGFKLSPMYRMRAGDNFARTFVTRELNYANPTINAEPMDARRSDNIHVVDLRVDRGFAFGAVKVSPYLDLYNILNANPVQNITVSSGANFLRPILIVAPRIVRIGARVDW
ncbi:MAG: TonB-dependent receptor [Acidobacteria bacterium]|nr:TonB-dependent receptor [Acidobacteriota bacterium]